MRFFLAKSFKNLVRYKHLGGGAWRRSAHAEVPSAKQDLVNKPIKKTKTPPRLDNSDKVRSGGAGEKVPETQGLSRLGLPGRTGGPDMGGPELGPNLGPKNVKKFEPEKQILERSEPVKNNPNLGPKNVKKFEPETQILERSEPKKNNPNLGPKNVKKLELFPPRIIKKAKRQKKYTSDRNEDQPSITKFLRGVPTPDNTTQQVNGTTTPGSGPGLWGVVPTGKLEKLKPNKRKFTDKFSDNEDFLREAKFVKLENSDALPHKWGQEVEDNPPPPP